MPASPAIPPPDALARLDWSVPEGTDAVILEVGANDMLRGIKPQVDARGARHNSATFDRSATSPCCCAACARRQILGLIMCDRSKRIYPELAAKYGVLLYPFFLDGVAADLGLLQQDGLHPNAAGVDVIVAAYSAEGGRADRPAFAAQHPS